MPRKNINPCSPRHVMIFDDDWEFLRSMYGPGSTNPQIGLGQAIRTIVHQKVQQIRAHIEDRRDAEIDRGRLTR